MACAPVASAPATDREIERLLAALQDDDVERRDHAAAELVRRGTSVADRVLALKTAGDPETRARAAQVAAQILDSDSYVPLVVGAEWRYRRAHPHGDLVVRCNAPRELEQVCYPGMPHIEDALWRMLPAYELEGLFGQTIRARRVEDAVFLGGRVPPDDEDFRTLLRLDWGRDEMCHVLGTEPLMSCEEVTVPAGTFACRLVIGEGASPVMWLARGVGVVKMIYSDEHGRRIVAELASFKPY